MNLQTRLTKLEEVASLPEGGAAELDLKALSDQELRDFIAILKKIREGGAAALTPAELEKGNRLLALSQGELTQAES